MPIGSSKVGVMGAGLVPGGTQTFNASGTFTVPPGVRKVNITGKGGTGNPGNAGNAGNSGGAGSGGAGGAGGISRKPCPCLPGFNVVSGNGAAGGAASRPGMINRGSITLCPGPVTINPWWPAGTAPPTYINQISIGGFGGPSQNAAQSGQSGDAGTAGNAGNAGNPGQSSSGICKTFPGGAGGNAGAGGAAGNGGSGGGGGGNGANANISCPGNSSGGSGGSGGGSGGNGSTQNAPGGAYGIGAGGGGGAGATNSGYNGQASSQGPTTNNLIAARGGEDTQVSATVNSSGGPYSPASTPANILPSNTMGGAGGGSASAGFHSIRFGAYPRSATQAGYSNCPTDLNPARVNLPQFSPVPLAPNIIRAGGGGGSSPNCPNVLAFRAGGGGGGGGRGNVGNAGGNSSAPSGSAGTPQTFNCVPVTPGSPYPITVGTPGGQVVISWNPQ